MAASEHPLPWYIHTEKGAGVVCWIRDANDKTVCDLSSVEDAEAILAALTAAKAQGAEEKRVEVEKKLAPIVEALRREGWGLSAQEKLNEWSHAIREATLPPPSPSPLAVELVELALSVFDDVPPESSVESAKGKLASRIDSLLREKGVVK